jgi:hypothetical protein
MKTTIRKVILIFLFIVAPASVILADDPGPPNPGGDPTGGGGQPIGAPIDGGLSILLAMGAAYGGLKLYRSKKKEEESVPEES